MSWNPAGDRYARRHRPAAGLLAVILAGALAAVAGCSSSGSKTSSAGDPTSDSSTLVTVKFAGACGACASYGPLYVGIQQGIFKKYGLDVQTSNLTTSAGVSALLNGDVDFYSDGAGLASGILQSPSSAKVIFARGVTPFYIAGAKGHSNTIASYKGQTIAATGSGSASDIVLRLALKANGLIPGQDVKITYINDPSADLAALQHGAVQGAVVTFPQSYQARISGSPLLEITSYGPQSIQAVSSNWAKNHPKALQNFIKAYAEATRLADSNESVTVKALTRIGATTTTAAAQAAWKVYHKSWSVIPLSDDQARAVTNSLTPRSTAAPSAWVDNSYINAVGSADQAVPPAN